MASLDELFYKEFDRMMKARKAENGFMDLKDVPVPPNNFVIEHRDKVMISGIEDEMYSRLNGQECLLWGRKALSRRKFDHKGEFIKKNDNFVFQEVTCPNECVAVIADIPIGVSLKYKPKEKFEYVDMVTRTNPDGSEDKKYVYIVPKKYCFKINQTALVISWTKLRVFYSGIALSLCNGHVMFMYIIPYKPSSQVHNYRVLHCKTTDDFGEEVGLLRNYWIQSGFMFNPDDCVLLDYVKGRENMAFLRLDGVLDVYERFNADRSLDSEETLEDVIVGE